MEIAELSKPAGTNCPHRIAEKGCAIYGQHPPTCRAFRCQWLLAPDLPPRLRPDRCKVVLDVEPPQRLIARCDPLNPTAWRKEPIYGVLKARARASWGSATVHAQAGRRLWLIAPNEDRDLGEVHPRSPIVVALLEGGGFTVDILPPVPEGEDLAGTVETMQSLADLARKTRDG